MRAATRLDLVLAVGFTAAAVAESLLRFHGDPLRLTLNLVGASLLAALAVRRTRPLLTLASIGAAGIIVAAGTHLARPGEPVESTVAVLAMMLATYSVGAYCDHRAAIPMALAVPLVVVLAIDLTTTDGWSLVSGVLFISLFVGAAPMLVGRLVRARSRTVERLRCQREEIVRQQRQLRDATILAERVSVAERLGPALVNGLRRLGRDAANDAPAGEIEEQARLLLARTRTEVVALTAGVDPDPKTLCPAPVVAGDNAREASWRVLAIMASTWVAIDVAAHWFGPFDGDLAYVGLLLGLSLVAGSALRWPITLLGLLICVGGNVISVGLNDLPGVTAAIVAAWAAGLVLRDLRSTAQQLRATNDVLASQEQELAQRAVVAERLRIARDLHDSLGHTLTVVALQAGAARRLAHLNPERAAEIVRGLAQVADDGVQSLAFPEPTSGIAELVDRTRAAGLVVSADLDDEFGLSGEARAIAYRVVQESLTNVLRHAPGAQTSVVLRRCADHIEVEVTNTAPTGNPESRGSGRGLTGIRARVAEGAGDVNWGPRPEGGFALLARLPVEAELR